MEVTRTLARYLVRSRYADLPHPVRHEAARALLNCLGCAIGASRHETVERALAAIREFAGPPQATVLGRSERLDILNAAFVNGVSSHVLDFDDTHARAVHPSAPVLPAALAFSEWRKVRGEELVHAFVQELSPGARRAERPHRSAARREELHLLGARHRGAPRLCARAVDPVRSRSDHRSPGRTLRAAVEHVQALCLRARDARRDRRLHSATPACATRASSSSGAV